MYSYHRWNHVALERSIDNLSSVAAICLQFREHHLYTREDM